LAFGDFGGGIGVVAGGRRGEGAGEQEERTRVREGFILGRTGESFFSGGVRMKPDALSEGIRTLTL